MKRFKNQSGSAVISIAITLLVLGGACIMVILARQNNLDKVVATSRAIYDAEAATELFAKALKTGYDLATPMAESNLRRYADELGTSGVFIDLPYQLPFNTLTGATSTPTVVTKPVQIYLPDGNRICVQRASSLGLIGGSPICITLPTDFVVKHDHDGEKSKRVFARGERGGSSLLARMVTWFSGVENIAVAEGVADPGPVAAAPSVQTATVMPGAYNPSTPTFNLRYANNNCAATTTDRFCITIKFCVKLAQNCLPEELVQQTYVLMRTPQTSVAN